MSSARLFSAACAIGLTLALGACGQSENANPSQDTGATTAPEAKPGLSLGAAKLVLPAVPGNPGAAYFTLSNGSDEAVGVAGVHIQGAQRTEIHQTSGGTMNLLENPTVPAKGSLQFAPGGDHVMVFGLDESLSANSTSEVTVTFSDGDKISAPIWIEAPGLSGEDSAEHGAHN